MSMARGFIRSSVKGVVAAIKVITVAASYVITANNTTTAILMPSTVNTVTNNASSCLVNKSILSNVYLNTVGNDVSTNVDKIAGVCVKGFLNKVVKGIGTGVFRGSVPSVDLSRVLGRKLVRSTNNFLVTKGCQTVARCCGVGSGVLSIVVSGLRCLNNITAGVFSRKVDREYRRW